jgi:hypothetical protein
MDTRRWGPGRAHRVRAVLREIIADSRAWIAGTGTSSRATISGAKAYDNAVVRLSA